MKELLKRLLKVLLILSIGLLAACKQSVITREVDVFTESATTIALILKNTEEVLPINTTQIDLPTQTPSISAVIPTPSDHWVVKEHWTPGNQIRIILIDRDNDIWTGNPGGVVHWDIDGGKLTSYILNDEPSMPFFITSLAQTSDGAIWVGTDGKGLSRWNGEEWDIFTTEDGLPSNNILDLLVTNDGSLLVNVKEMGKYNNATLGQFSEDGWIEITFSSSIDDLLINSKDIVWRYGNGGSLTWPAEIITFYNDGQWNPIAARGTGRDRIFAVAFDNQDRLWSVIGNRFYSFDGIYWSMHTPRWVKVQDWDGVVTDMAVNKNGDIWFSFTDSFPDFPLTCNVYKAEADIGVYRYDGKDWFLYTKEDGLADNHNCAMAIGKDGTVWVGSYDQGLSYFDGEKWSYIRIK
ncbi:MAG: hypothetical protein CVU39_16245 [Chloroflexi bacterium HGW-Chloroflexi-10]|nr:MAG: hypothetical protein CVU39_16245 [Chloroflexi bacterium HGW-Chloroflexi-10]